jgi:uncharacterized protein (DUF58 family)
MVRHSAALGQIVARGTVCRLYRTNLPPRPYAKTTMLIENQLKKLGFGTAAAFLLIVAMLLGAPQMYLMAIIVALVPVAGWFLGKVLMQGLVCDRTSPATADEHGRMTVTVTVRNQGLFPKFYLRITDGLPRYLRYSGSPSDESVFITQLWPGESSRVKYIVEPQRRGAHVIGPLSVRSTDVFGFSNLRNTSKRFSEVLVYPEVLPVTPTLLSGGASTGWRDEMNARSRGDGIDFTGVREYRPGDELRRINWKTTARTGALAVTEYTQGFATDLTILLDRQASAYVKSGIGVGSAFEYAVKIANSLGATALRQGSCVDLMCMANESDHVVQMRDYAEISILFDFLARVEADGSVDIEQQFSTIWREGNPNSIFVVITPRKPDDPLVRGEIERWSRTNVSSCVNVFWLDKPSFEVAADQIRAGQIGLRTDGAGEPASKIRTEIGCEYTVSARTNLIALLGDSSVA